MLTFLSLPIPLQWQRAAVTYGWEGERKGGREREEEKEEDRGREGETGRELGFPLQHQCLPRLIPQPARGWRWPRSSRRGIAGRRGEESGAQAEPCDRCGSPLAAAWP